MSAALARHAAASSMSSPIRESRQSAGKTIPTTIERSETMLTNLKTTWLPLMLAIALLLLLGVAFASAEESNFYDRNGSYEGSVITHGNSTAFTDQHGHFAGSSITHGNSTSFYDRSGHFTGSVTRHSTSTSHPLTGGK